MPQGSNDLDLATKLGFLYIAKFWSLEDNH